VRLEVIEERDYVEKLGSGIRVDEPDEATENPKRIKFINKKKKKKEKKEFRYKTGIILVVEETTPVVYHMGSRREDCQPCSTAKCSSRCAK